MSQLIRHRILATAGHVDHGKSSLVEALTGTHPDRLPEEKKRGISIELGFAEIRLSDANGEIVAGIVDVPGHEDFIKTMTAGVAAADAALLVVAADDGVMPQTIEHLEILEYLGVRRGIVALTKGDLVHDIADARSRVAGGLRSTIFADMPIVPVSIRQPQTLSPLITALTTLLSALPDRIDPHKPRLWIDRAFTGKGVGTVLAGTLCGGSLRRDQAIKVLPRGQAARIRSLHSYHRPVESAAPGSRVAMNVPALSLAANEPLAVERGQLVSIEGVCAISRTIDICLTRSQSSTAQPPADGSEVRVYVGSASTVARIHRYHDPQFARLHLQDVLPFLIGDRLVLRNASDRLTLAGGTVLDVAPPKKRRWRTDVQQLRLLQLRTAEACGIAAVILSIVERDGFVDRSVIDRATSAAASDVDEQIRQLAADGKVIVIASQLASSAWIRTARAELQQAVRAHHLQHPQRPGLPLSDARALLRRIVRQTEINDRLLDAIISDDIERVGQVLRARSFKPALPPRLAKAGDKLREALATGGLAPLSRPQLARTDLEQEALRFLFANGEAVDLGPDVALSFQAYTFAIAAVRQHLANGPATVTQLKTLLNSSRRIMIPLLERLDREGVTRRQGDLRSLPPSG